MSQPFGFEDSRERGYSGSGRPLVSGINQTSTIPAR
jgi:hypothetical protein